MKDLEDEIQYFNELICNKFVDMNYQFVLEKLRNQIKEEYKDETLVNTEQLLDHIQIYIDGEKIKLLTDYIAQAKTKEQVKQRYGQMLTVAEMTIADLNKKHWNIILMIGRDKVEQHLVKAKNLNLFKNYKHKTSRIG